MFSQVPLAVPRGGQEPLQLKVAPIQPGVTAERQRLPNVGIGGLTYNRGGGGEG